MKEKLLRAMHETSEKERDLEALCVDAPADPSGRWSAKDHLAHMAGTRERHARVIAAVVAGTEVPPRTENLSDVIYASTKDLRVAEVIAQARRAWEHMLAAVESASEADLEKPNPHSPQRTLVDGSPGDHLGAHLMWVYLESGDTAGAESIQRWARDLSIRTQSDARSRAVADYNLACFYSRVGQPDEALPLLRAGIEGDPSLKEWSHQDPDLDPIRHDPRVKELLAT